MGQPTPTSQHLKQATPCPVLQWMGQSTPMSQHMEQATPSPVSQWIDQSTLSPITMCGPSSLSSITMHG